MQRRQFLTNIGAVAALGAVGCADSGNNVLINPTEAQTAPPGGTGGTRQSQVLALRNQACQAAVASVPAQVSNGDELLYSNRIGSFSKGLPHNALGEVDSTAYNAYLSALQAGTFAALETVTLGGVKKLVNPMAGLDLDLEGPDSYSLTLPPAPAFASAQTAGEAVELYWMSLCRDINFTDYATDAGTIPAALAGLNALSDFRGPKVNGQVSLGSLFRSFVPGSQSGPFVSQLLFKDCAAGAMSLSAKINTALAGFDFMSDFASFLAIQNGANPSATNHIDPTPRYIRNFRDLAAYVHNDQAYQACFVAAMALQAINAPLAPGNPYLTSATQSGFATLGAPNVLTFLAEVTTRALKAMWAQKWFVHRRVRPEALGGSAHNVATGHASYPIHSDLMNSSALARVFANNGTYLLPQAFPEGCPLHPSYGAGHSVLGGACTILKAFYNENTPWPNPVVAAADGLSLLPYSGPDAGQMTVGGEINKLATCLGHGRLAAGLHFRSDHEQAMLMGEAVAIGLLQETKATYLEPVTFQFTNLSGVKVTI